MALTAATELIHLRQPPSPASRCLPTPLNQNTRTLISVSSSIRAPPTSLICTGIGRSPSAVAAGPRPLMGSMTNVKGLRFAVVTIIIIALSSYVSDAAPLWNSGLQTLQRHAKVYRRLQVCEKCDDEKENGFSRNISAGENSRQSDESVDVTVAYTDASGAIKMHTIKSRDLSSSWKWEPVANKHAPPDDGVRHEDSSVHNTTRLQDVNQPSVNHSQQDDPVDPIKLRRQYLRQRRREKRSAELINVTKEDQLQAEAAAIERAKNMDTTKRGKYSIWRREYQNPLSDSTLKLMKDQIIMAKVYASIAHVKGKLQLYDSLTERIRDNQQAIGEANSDAELHNSALERAKTMGHALSIAKDLPYDCEVLARKLRATIQSTEENINSLKRQNAFLIQHAAKTAPKPLHCLPLQLTTDYFAQKHTSEELSNKEKLEDPSLYHYAIFSDNVLATSVVVNSTLIHAKEPDKHVFHIVTDRLIFAAMKMWFIAHPPLPATVEVENIDEFKWLNSSYCSVLRQLESARIKEYYFKANHPSSLSVGNENLKYRNPKYLSMLNHLRFYMPEVYPKLDKILFLDDDIVVQKDLTPLWSVDMKGMVNGAIETCKESFHRFDTYLNFSNPKISENFDPQACGWAFGMNIFDLREWKKRNITGIYHYWQDLNEDRKLWKLGSLPPGLITFYNLTLSLDRSWHVLGLGYDPAISPTDIENAAVIHYNGNYKPWLELAISKYKPYWSKYVPTDNPYIQGCYAKP